MFNWLYYLFRPNSDWAWVYRDKFNEWTLVNRGQPIWGWNPSWDSIGLLHILQSTFVLEPDEV